MEGEKNEVASSDSVGLCSGSSEFHISGSIRGINIDFVTVGHAGNASDTQVMMTNATNGYGAVSYNYRIGKYTIPMVILGMSEAVQSSRMALMT
jgi:hypothetical protein